MGEMGSAVGRALAQSGAHVVTYVEGRSDATRQRALAAGLTQLPSLDALVVEVELIVAIVPPLAAEPLAREIAAAMRRAGAGPLYCDANSIGPTTARSIEGAITGAGGRFVDGAIIGGAGGVPSRVTLYLAGEHASEVAELLDPIPTQVLGGAAGEASAFKVLYAGLTKGMSALGMELLGGAERLGLRDLVMAKYHAEHPSVARFLEGNLPSLPPRAGRRAEEMVELAEMLEGLGLPAHMARAAQATLAEVGDRDREEAAPVGDSLDGVLRWWVA